MRPHAPNAKVALVVLSLPFLLASSGCDEVGWPFLAKDTAMSVMGSVLPVELDPLDVDPPAPPCPDVFDLLPGAILQPLGLWPDCRQ